MFFLLNCYALIYAKYPQICIKMPKEHQKRLYLPKTRADTAQTRGPLNPKKILLFHERVMRKSTPLLQLQTIADMSVFVCSVKYQ